MSRISIIAENNEYIPSYETYGSAGADLKACLGISVITINPGERALVPTGVKVAIPSGYEMQIRPRSGMAFKKGITVLNAPGTIDSDYRGEVKVLLVNTGKEPVMINDKDRIAQCVIAPYVRVEWVPTEKLPATPRGEGGFGHTGDK